MKIVAADVYRYRLPLVPPLQVDGGEVRTREGVLIRCTARDGSAGWGEAAPLPGFSTESLEAAIHALRKIVPSLMGQSIPDALPEVGAILQTRDDPALPASARFGVELALWDLMARIRDVPLPSVIAPHSRPVVSINALLTGAPEEVLQRAQHVREAGYRAAKLKVGRRNLKTEIELVRALDEAWGGTVTLRLDANRAWHLDEAQAFAEGIADVPVEYIEEPLADPNDLPIFAADSDLPVALDESMREMEVEELERHCYARAAVMKPMLVGGGLHTIRMAERAVELGMTPVLSAAYESGVGLRGLIALAAAIGERDVPVGLDTYERLCNDVLSPRLAIDGARIDVAAMMATEHRVDLHNVEPLPHREGC